MIAGSGHDCCVHQAGLRVFKKQVPQLFGFIVNDIPIIDNKTGVPQLRQGR
jgi:hypothetical protein